MPDYYNILHLDPEASFIAIDDAYHRLVRLHAGDESALRLLREAFAVLSDPPRRTEYDLRRGQAAGARGAPSARPVGTARPTTEMIDTQPPAARPPSRSTSEMMGTRPPARPATEMIDTRPPAARPPRPQTELLDVASPPRRPPRQDTDQFDTTQHADPEAAGPVVPLPPGPVRVTVIGPDGRTTTCALGDGEHVIGRPSKSGGEPAVKLEDRFVSRKHAVIVREFGSLVILDNSSVNGTRLNGRRLVAGRPYPLNDGDTIEIETFTLRVAFGDEGQADGEARHV